MKRPKRDREEEKQNEKRNKKRNTEEMAIDISRER